MATGVFLWGHRFSGSQECSRCPSSSDDTHKSVNKGNLLQWTRYVKIMIRPSKTMHDFIDYALESSDLQTPNK